MKEFFQSIWGALSQVYPIPLPFGENNPTNNWKPKLWLLFLILFVVAVFVIRKLRVNLPFIGRLGGTIRRRTSRIRRTFKRYGRRTMRRRTRRMRGRYA